MIFAIWYQYKGCPAEVVDECDTKEEAEKLLAEYRMAYGTAGRLWLVKQAPSE